MEAKITATYYRAKEKNACLLMPYQIVVQHSYRVLYFALPHAVFVVVKCCIFG
jgi:hypothetical protein